MTHPCIICTSHTYYPDRVCDLCRGRYKCYLCHETHFGVVCDKALDGDLYRYNDNPLLHLKPDEIAKKQKTADMYGVELEAYAPNDCRGDKVCEIYAAVGRSVMVKYDGSLSEDRGLEIVTIPLSFKEQKNLWKKLFDRVRGLTSWRHGTCGIHVHIGTYGLTELEKSKILVFVNRASNGAFLTELAGRDVSRAAQWCRQKNYRKFMRASRYDCRHYDAAALAKGGKTIEVRIWRGNASYHGVIRAVEFCDALKTFVRENSVKDLNWRKFVQWFLKNKNHNSKYRELHRQIKAIEEKRKETEKAKRLARKQVKKEVTNVCDNYNAQQIAA